MSVSRKTKYQHAALASAVVMAAAGHSMADLFTQGDLIVSAYGSPGSDLPQGAPSPISLIEYSISGGLPILTDTLPTTDGVGGSNNLGIVGQYGSSSEGNIQLSGDGRYLTIAGYSATEAALGIQASTKAASGTKAPIGSPYESSTVSLAQSTDTDVARIAALVDPNGNVNSSTVLNDVFNTNNARSAYSSNGTTFYISGQGDGSTMDQGLFNGPIGLNTIASPGTPPTGIYNSSDTRFVTAFNGSLYQSMDTSSGPTTGIWKFNGMPTASATPTRITAANNGKSGGNEVFYSPEGFYFANASTLYVADTGDPKAGSPGDGGIQKWILNQSVWTLQYTLTPSNVNWILPGNPGDATKGETGFEAITGQVVGTGASAKVELFAISYTLGDDNPDGLYTIDDTLDSTTGAGETFTELESSLGGGDQTFKGVSFAPVPEPASFVILCLGGAFLSSRGRSRSPARSSNSRT